MLYVYINSSFICPVLYAREITTTFPVDSFCHFIQLNFRHISLGAQPTVPARSASAAAGANWFLLPHSLAVFRFSGHSLKIYVSLGLCLSRSLRLGLCPRLCLWPGTTDVPSAFAIAASAT